VRRSEPRIDSSCCFSTAQESDSRSNVSLATQFFSSPLDRIAAAHKDDWDAGGCGLGGLRWSITSDRSNHRHLAANQLGCERRQSIVLPFR
jgi:hypothetical protein